MSRDRIVLVALAAMWALNPVCLPGGPGQLPAQSNAQPGAQSDLLAEKHWTRFTTNEGLAQNMVLVGHLDSRGFLWFGTKSGLSRYDGYTFRNFQHDPSDSASISGKYITSLHECPNGDLWIGFTDGSVDIFHRRQERFQHLRAGDLFSPDNHPRLVLNIVEDTAGVHWFTTEGWGLHQADRISPGTDGGEDRYRITTHREVSQDSVRIDCARPVILLADRSGGVLVQGEEGSVWLNRKLPPSVRLPRPRDLKPGTPHWAWFVLEDNSGKLWLHTPGLIATLDPATGAFTSRRLIDSTLQGTFMWDRQRNPMIVSNRVVLRIDRNDPDHQEIRHLPVVNFGMQCIVLDSSDAIWVGSPGQGLFRYDNRAERFGLRSGTNWWGLVGDVVRHFGFPPKEDPSASSFPYARLYWSHVARERGGSLWADPVVRSYTDFEHFDPRSGSVRKFSSQLLGWREATEWYGGWGGLSLFSLSDTAGNFWIGRLALYKYEAGSGTFRTFQLHRDSLIETPVARGDRTASIISTWRDPDGTFWLGTVSHGLYHLDPITLELRHFENAPDDPASLSHNHVLSLRGDPVEPERYLWIGTDGGGLNRLDKQTGRFHRIGQAEGLPDNVIYAILPDRRGRLWMSTNRGLARMDPASLTFRNFDESDGLTIMEFNREEFHQDETGKMYFGNLGGVNVFDPEAIGDNLFSPPVVMTDLQVRNASVSVRDPESVLTESISETRELTLPWEMNVFTLEYAALDFANPGKNKYSHMLEGFEEEWSPPSISRTATYTNLDPGEYTFRVRGSNCDGIWNMTGTTLSIVILPPWYRTAWAYASYVFLALTGLILFRRYDLKRVRLKDQLDLEQARSAQLREVDQLKMRFFQNVSHEFRTPLTLILGPVEKLLEGLSDQSHKRELRVVRRNAQRLLGLINQILDVSKLEAGGTSLRASESDLVQLVRGVTMAFHSLAEKKGIFLDVQHDMPALSVWFDQDKLEKVLVNLLGNAFKFTPDTGEIIVRVSSDGREAIISVRDTGIGIANDRIGHIFDRFYQVDSSTTRSAEGTGIGLSLVKDFVELHHGRVEVSSQPGHGSEFTIHLPLGRDHLGENEVVADTDSAAAGRPEAAYGPGSVPRKSYPVPIDGESVEETTHGGMGGNGVEGRPAGGTQVNGARTDGAAHPLILIVEDNADVRHYVRSCLEAGYAIIEANDGIEGVAAATEKIPDLVISDVMMPGLDGYGLCSRLKENEVTSHIPVILLTAKAAKEDRIGGLETGADDYLIKPFDANELLVRVRNLIDVRRKLREKFSRELVTLKPDEIRVTPAEEVFVRKVIQAVEKRLSDENFSVEDLAGMLSMSYTQLHRKLKAVTDQSAAHFIRTMRLKRAMELLGNGAATISEISYSVGFGSPAYFTKCFQEEFGKTPSEVSRTRRA